MDKKHLSNLEIYSNELETINKIIKNYYNFSKNQLKDIENNLFTIKYHLMLAINRLKAYNDKANSPQLIELGYNLDYVQSNIVSLINKIQ